MYMSCWARVRDPVIEHRDRLGGGPDFAKWKDPAKARACIETIMSYSHADSWLVHEQLRFQNEPAGSGRPRTGHERTDDEK